MLLIDESAADVYVAWADIEKKLVRDNPLVVTVACSRAGYARHAQAALPAAVYPEVTDDFPPAVDSVAASFRIATPLVNAPAGMVNPRFELLGGVSRRPAARAGRRNSSEPGKGTLVTYADGKSAAVKDMTADDFWKALNAGGCWIGPDGAQRRRRRSIRRTVPSGMPALPAARLAADADVPPAALISPLMSKVYQESNLRLAPNRVALHPAEARQCGLEEGATRHAARRATAECRWR